MITESNFLSEYQQANQQKKGVVLIQELPSYPADITQISANLERHQEFLTILESQEDGSGRGRFSYIGLDPDWVWTCDLHSAQLSTDGGHIFETKSHLILESFRDIHAQSQCIVPHSLPGMAAGLIGYMAYDAIRLIEPSVAYANPDLIDIPIGIFIRPTLSIVLDHQTDTVTLCAPIWAGESDPTQTFQKAQHKLKQMVQTLQDGDIKPSPSQFSKPSIHFVPEQDKASFHSKINKAKDYIVAGDIFQVVPSQRWTSAFESDPFFLYQELRELNPSPFMFYLNFKTFQLVGASPEIMVRVQDETVTIRPLAGTRPRGKNEAEDVALKNELLADQKELAEHLMLVDLSRHDVARVTRPGTVTVTEFQVIEYYSHVMHITSNVEGKLDPSKDALDALFSALPVGTVSGAPKVRAMQIIDELEPSARSFYAGCVGYFAADGNMDTCITLRTALVKDKTLYVQAGAGVVADSDPEKEYQETVNKVAVLKKAAENVQKNYY